MTYDLTLIGARVLHTGAVGTVVADDGRVVELHVPGEHLTRLLLRRVALEYVQGIDGEPIQHRLITARATL